MLTIELLKQALKKGLKLILALIIEKTHFSVRFQKLAIRKRSVNFIFIKILKPFTTGIFLQIL